MSGLSANDAERQAREAAAGYLNRAMRILAERFCLEKPLENDPAGFAGQFSPLLVALIEAQTREYQSWVISQGLESLAAASRAGLEDLANVFSERLQL